MYSDLFKMAFQKSKMLFRHTVCHGIRLQYTNLQGFGFKNGRGALNCSPERFKESCQESDSYEHH